MRQTVVKAFFPSSPITVRIQSMTREIKSFNGKGLIPPPFMYSTIQNVAEPPPRSLPSLRLPSGDSSRSSSSIDSCFSECIGSRYPRRQRLSPRLIVDNNNSSRHARKRVLPVDLPLKNDLFVPPPDAHNAIKQKQKRKLKRERKTAAGAVGGMVAGGLVFGPVGVVVGATVGGFTTRQIAKKADKRSQRRREQKSFRDFAASKAIQWRLNGDAAVFV